MKKTLALVMALALVFSLGSVAFAAHTGEHATAPTIDPSTHKATSDGEAAVDATDTADSRVSDTGSTQMYLQIKKDTLDAPVEQDIQEVVVGANGEKYVVDTKKEVKSNISVTVPLYVCMYASSTAGKVFVPAADKYTLKNYSNYYSNEKVSAVTKYAQTKDTLAELLGAEYVANNVYKATDGTTLTIPSTITSYPSATYNFYIDSAYTVQAVAKSDCKVFPEDATTYWKEIQRADTDGQTMTVYGADGSETPYTIGGGSGAEIKYKGLSINVSKLGITVATGWTLRDADDFANLSVKKEFTMTINGQDLYDVQTAGNSISLTDTAGWSMSAPTAAEATGAVTTPTSLSLPITAAIAKGEVNDDTGTGDAMVITVTYTLAAGDMSATA